MKSKGGRVEHISGMLLRWRDQNAATGLKPGLGSMGIRENPGYQTQPDMASVSYLHGVPT